jgi:hypothetical protein
VTERRPTAAAPGRRGPRRLHRKVLSLAVAALLAACLPFSILYVDAVQHRAAGMANVAAPYGGGHTRLVTTTSGGTRTIAASGSSAAPQGSPTPVTTRGS